MMSFTSLTEVPLAGRFGDRDKVVSEGGLETKLHAASETPTFGYQPPDQGPKPVLERVDSLRCLGVSESTALDRTER
jgi:hypothetical protein